MTGRWLALLALLVAGAGPMAAQDRANTGLEPLTRRDQILGWEAVGRIDLGPAGADAGFCTGALISTTLVLTAGHCVFGPQGQPVPPEGITFRAGYADGTSVAKAAVARTVAHPLYDPLTPPSPRNVRHDLALLELATPIPAAVAAPFAIRAPGTGDQVSVVSYAQGRAEALSWQRACAVLARQDGLVAMDCDVTFGASGAPVFDRSGARPWIVSIISAGGPTDDGVIAYGMDLPDVVADLMARLARGQVLATASATAARPETGRLGTGTGGRRDIGARFVKP